MLSLNVVEGDITRTEHPVDAIVTLINAMGQWWGGVDLAINSVAGNVYHDQVAAASNRDDRHDGRVFVTTGDRADHEGNFNNVIFVIDRLQKPLADLVHNALRAAVAAGFRSVAMPVMRTGVMLGAVEDSLEDVVRQMKLGFDRFEQELPNVDLTVYTVVYKSPETVKLLSDML